MTELRIIYIGGIEHNGSTFLGITLGNHPQIQCVGELSQLPRLGWDDDKQYLCACGENISTCPFWTEVLQEWKDSSDGDIKTLLKLEAAIDRNICLPRVMVEKYIQSSLFKEYCSHTRTLFRAIRKASGNSVIVDTSKRVARALALSMIEEIDLRLIHLMRDARGVAHSSVKPARAIRRPYWQSAVRWNLINSGIEQVRRRISDEESMFVRYEDLVTRPVEILANIGDFVDVDLSLVSQAVLRGEILPAGHLGIGNSLRLQGGVQLRSSDEWPQMMSKEDQRQVLRLTGRMMRRYGYEP